MGSILPAFGFGLLGYLSGSLPFALWITRLLKGVDVRAGGSGHATATNTIRTAGWTAGVIVLLLDITKGYLPTWLALNNAGYPWMVGLTAALVVTGHCWTVFAGFRGGMGLATAGGAILAISPLAFLISLGVLIALALFLHHSARAAVITGCMLPFVYLLFGFRGTLIWVGVGVGFVIAVRFLMDWNRVYRELWLDREPKTKLY